MTSRTRRIRQAEEAAQKQAKSGEPSEFSLQHLSAEELDNISNKLTFLIQDSLLDRAMCIALSDYEYDDFLVLQQEFIPGRHPDELGEAFDIFHDKVYEQFVELGGDKRALAQSRIHFHKE